MLAYEQLHIPPGRQRKGCCQECSLCCCRCCLGTSVVFAIIFAVAGGILIYAFREDSFDRISVSVGYYSADYQYSLVMRTLGYALVVFGAIMFICIFVSASFVCCLTPTKTNQSTAIIVNQPGDILNSPPLATVPNPSAPLEPPPSYESIAQEKV